MVERQRRVQLSVARSHQGAAFLHVATHSFVQAQSEQSLDVYVIGRSMFETDRIHSDWIGFSRKVGSAFLFDVSLLEKCNQEVVREIWVPSQFNVKAILLAQSLFIISSNFHFHSGLNSCRYVNICRWADLGSYAQTFGAAGVKGDPFLQTFKFEKALALLMFIRCQCK